MRLVAVVLVVVAAVLAVPSARPGRLAVVLDAADLPAAPDRGRRQRTGRGARRARGSRRTDVALVADLLAGCLAAGVALPAAMCAVAEATYDVELAALCRRTGAAMASGAGPSQLWAGWSGADAAPLGRVLQRTRGSGAAAAGELRRCAVRLREQGRAAATADARRAGVRVVVPLGLCFLPAFVLVGVVPLAVGLLARR